MSTWRMLRNIAKNKTESLRNFWGKKDGIGSAKQLPLGIRLGGKIEIEQTPFIMAKAAPSRGEAPLQVETPGKEHIVVAYGQIEYHDVIIHRFYLESTESSKEAMLQIVEQDGEFLEHRLFRTRDEVYPQDDAEWSFWLDEDDGYIGLKCFTLKSEDFQEQSPPSYSRVWGDDGVHRAQPFEWEEAVQNAQNDSLITITHQLMTYGRWIDEDNDIAEYALVSVEETSDEASVNIALGVDIEPAGINIIY